MSFCCLNLCISRGVIERTGCGSGLLDTHIPGDDCSGQAVNTGNQTKGSICAIDKALQAMASLISMQHKHYCEQIQNHATCNLDVVSMGLHCAMLIIFMIQ